MIMANGMLYANPHVKWCGFMYPIQEYSNIPFHGWRKHIGKRMKTMAVTRTSRMFIGSPG
jgi:hypothetical protein